MNKIKFPFHFSLFTITLALASCADLSYNEASSRDEAWTYNSPINGVKALVYDVYAQMPSEFKDNLYGNGAMIASATDEASCLHSRAGHFATNMVSTVLISTGSSRATTPVARPHLPTRNRTTRC